MFAEEVEEVLKQHPGIADAAVLGVSDERLGRKVVALLRAGERPPSEEELHTHARAHLAGYKVPKHMAYVDSLERADNGKLDHRRLTGIAESKWGRPRLTRTGGRSPDRLPGFPRRPGKAAAERDTPPHGGEIPGERGQRAAHGKDGTGSHLPPLGKPA
ncbi:AMP-binding enzyme [Streptomyces sp. INA 01156]